MTSKDFDARWIAEQREQSGLPAMTDQTHLTAADLDRWAKVLGDVETRHPDITGWDVIHVVDPHEHVTLCESTDLRRLIAMARASLTIPAQVQAARREALQEAVRGIADYQLGKYHDYSQGRGHQQTFEIAKMVIRALIPAEGQGGAEESEEESAEEQSERHFQNLIDWGVLDR